jgi:hypothetical protein
MSKLIATLVASMFAAAAFAQTGATPPVQPPAGTNPKMEMKKDDMTKKVDDKMGVSEDKQAARKAKRAARKTKRAEKVGDKPLN